jgi:hypothetical protein
MPCYILPIIILAGPSKLFFCVPRMILTELFSGEHGNMFINMYKSPSHLVIFTWSNSNSFNWVTFGERRYQLLDSFFFMVCWNSGSQIHNCPKKVHFWTVLSFFHHNYIFGGSTFSQKFQKFVQKWLRNGLWLSFFTWVGNGDFPRRVLD